jgi:hypothetical protein
MTDILRHKVSNDNIGSTEDRLAVQSLIKKGIEIDPRNDQNKSLAGYARLAQIMENNGTPILNNLESDETWDIDGIQSKIPTFFIVLFSLGNRFSPLLFPKTVIRIQDLLVGTDALTVLVRNSRTDSSFST